MKMSERLPGTERRREMKTLIDRLDAARARHKEATEAQRIELEALTSVGNSRRKEAVAICQRHQSEITAASQALSASANELKTWGEGHGFSFALSRDMGESYDDFASSLHTHARKVMADIEQTARKGGREMKIYRVEVESPDMKTPTAVYQGEDKKQALGVAKWWKKRKYDIHILTGELKNQ